jgi:DNA-binding NarL/FixJ family response regulator
VERCKAQDDGGTAMHVLICDHQPLFRQGLAEVIRQLDASARLTETAEPFAVEGAPAEPVNLILIATGLLQDRDDGGLRRLRQRHPDAKVVLVGSRASRAEVDRYLAEGGAGVILRSDPPRLIRSALQLVLDGGVFLPSSVVAERRPDYGPRGEAAEGERPAAAGLAEARGKSALTRRQLTVLTLMGRGWSNKRIARELGVSEGTVKVHVNAILRALNVSNRTQAALEATRAGLSPAPETERD